MSIGIFVDPGYRPTFTPVLKPVAPATKPAPPPEPERELRDLLDHGEWEVALIQYLRHQNGRTAYLWPMLNEIAAAGMPESVWERRELKKRLLEALGQLIRDRQVRRVRRREIYLRESHSGVPRPCSAD